MQPNTIFIFDFNNNIKWCKRFWQKRSWHKNTRQTCFCKVIIGAYLMILYQYWSLNTIF